MDSDRKAPDLNPVWEHGRPPSFSYTRWLQTSKSFSFWKCRASAENTITPPAGCHSHFLETFAKWFFALVINMLGAGAEGNFREGWENRYDQDIYTCQKFSKKNTRGYWDK